MTETRTLSKRAWASVDRLLRGRPAPPENWLAEIARQAAIIVIAGCAYGAVMGTFGGVGPQRAAQIVYSAVKVPLLLSAAFLLSLPSFFVLNTLMGLRRDWGRSVTAVAGAQAGLTVILASLAPFTALCYVSGCDYPNAILFNGFMFAVASVSAQLILRRAYRRLMEDDPRHRWMPRTWLVIYGFVGIQMGWVLRPFIGDPMLPTRFIRPGAMSNAYIVLTHLLLSQVQ
jgi:hypothetical protein